MEKRLKHQIRKLWRDRMLLSMGGLIVVGFSALQIQSMFKYRPAQPPWVLELSHAVEILAKAQRSNEELTQAISKIQSISQERNLQLTAVLFEKLESDWALARARELTLDLDRELDLALGRALHRTLDLDRELDLALGRPLDQDLEVIRGVGQARPMAITVPQPITLNLRVEQARDLNLNLNLTSRLVAQLVQMSTRRASHHLFVPIIAAELEQTHGFTLQKGNTLENLLSNESNRARSLIQSGVLLGASVLVLLGLLMTLTRLQDSGSIPRSAHLIAFLPEECVAELGYLQRRLEKANTPIWGIRRRLTHEVVFLLWVHYVQMQLDNLFLDDN